MDDPDFSQKIFWSIATIGFIFGAAARWGDFCFLRGFKQLFQPKNQKHIFPALHTFALALAVAIIFSQTMDYFGAMELKSAQISRLQFSLSGTFFGGLLFGLGMVAARACAGRALVLAAGGNLRMWWVLLWLGLAAQSAMTGLLAAPRQYLQSTGVVHLAAANVPAWLQVRLGWSTELALVLSAGVAAVGLLVFALRGRKSYFSNAYKTDATHFAAADQSAGRSWLAATLIGACVGAAWWVSAWANAQEFDPKPLQAISFVGAVAEWWLFAQLAVGREVSPLLPLMAGSLAGAFAVALLTGSLQLQAFGGKNGEDGAARMWRSAVGGICMGAGGVLAVGCTLGQGLSGLSALSISSAVAVAGIVAGAWVGLKMKVGK